MSKLNSIHCPACGTSVAIEVSVPKFCSECGSPLSVDPSGNQTKIDDQSSVVSARDPESKSTPPKEVQLDLTIAANALSGTDRDLDAVSRKRALDETSDSSFVIQRDTKAQALQTGDQIGPFRLGCVLGEGGMGTVYEAHDTERDCSVALKLLSRQVRTNKESVERFRRESQIAASINHPGSTFVYRSGQYGDQIFIAMELMNGGTLKDVVEEEGPLDFPRAVDFMIDAINGLSVAHKVGIVHRDFKPSNCFIDDDGRAKVGDFGLAKNFIGDVELTQTGTFIGTPQFAAPEQLRAANVDARTDIYSVGSTLFYLLSGRAPFIGDAAQVISGIAAEPAPNIKSIVPGIPVKLAQLIAQTLEKDPDRRPASLEHVRAALLPFSSKGAVPADTGRRVAGLFIDMFILGFVSFAAAIFSAPLSFAFAAADFSIDPNFIILLLNFPIVVLYFGIQEYIWGTSIGKWLMGMRVINQNYDSPKLWQALLRPAFVPGIRMLATIVGVYLYQPVSEQNLSAESLIAMASMSMLSLLSWIPCLLCLITARRSNGYRGVHDLITNTRVVRLSGELETPDLEDVAVTLPVPLDRADSGINSGINGGTNSPTSNSALALAPYEALGKLQLKQADRQSDTVSAAASVTVGRDPGLDRKVWIYETGNSQPPLTRTTIRPTRQRIIATKQDDSQDPSRHFFVTEAIEGMPLVDFIETSNPVQWTAFRKMLRELADELQEADKEGSLPDDFGVENLWLDRSGQIKVVELKLVASTGETATNSKEHVFLEILDRIIEHHPVPSHVINFHSNAQPDRLKMSKVIQMLDSMANLPSSWNWIDRLGLICVSLALELSVLLTIGLVWVVFANSLLELSSKTIFYSLLGIGLTLSFWIGLFFESPSFWFLGITAGRRGRRTPPSRIRLGCRTFVAWSLPIVMAATFAAMIAAGVEADKASQPPGALFFSMVLGFFGSSFLMLFVSLINLLNPSRGVADLICGTFLMRK
jgi:serine/threonine protein kinase